MNIFYNFLAGYHFGVKYACSSPVTLISLSTTLNTTVGSTPMSDQTNRSAIVGYFAQTASHCGEQRAH